MLNFNDPTPFDVINENGKAPLLIACDHAENRIPECLSGLGMDKAHLEKHIAYDIGAKQVSIMLSRMFDAPLICSGYSRLVIDLNRHLDAHSLVTPHSDNIDVPGNQNLSAEEIKQRIDCFFHPYHDQYARMAKRVVADHDQPLILSVHSFTPSINGIPRPWEYGVLWDDPHRKLSQMVIDNFRKIDGLTIGDNQPYHARDPMGYAQVEHAEKNGMEMALIEIRQDLIVDKQRQMQAAEIMYQVISPLIAQKASK